MKKKDQDPPYEALRTAGERVRAIAYLLESHNKDVMPVFDMSEVWSVVGNMLEDLGFEIMSITRELDEAHIRNLKHDK